MTDQFVLNRKVNFPELIYNQDPQKLNSDHRFFQSEASEYWQLSPKGECFVCDKYKYTAIFFKKGLIPNSNTDLHEIKDKNFISRIKKEYDSDPKNEIDSMPQICGSVVDGSTYYYPYSRLNFDRKL